MKKFIYISLVATGFILASCSKENIRPTCQKTDDAPVWRTSNSAESDDENSSDGNGGITDPNNDKDENSRRKN